MPQSIVAHREHAKIKLAFKPEVEHFPISKSQREREQRLGLVAYTERKYGPYWKYPPTKPSRYR